MSLVNSDAAPRITLEPFYVSLKSSRALVERGLAWEACRTVRRAARCNEGVEGGLRSFTAQRVTRVDPPRKAAAG